MAVYFSDLALLPDGWASNVRITVSSQGMIEHIEVNTSADGAEHLCGPLLPGMPNLHSHAFQRAMAGLAEVAGNPQDSFWTWRDLMYRMLGNMQPEDVSAIATQLYIEMLKAGYTSVAEFHYLHHDIHGQPYTNPAELGLRISEAAAQTGIGLTLLPVMYAHSGFGGQSPMEGQRRFINSIDSYSRLLNQLSDQLARQPLQRTGLCFHSLRAVTPDQLHSLLNHFPDTSLPVHIHIAEQMKEVNDCLSWSGQRPVEWLLNNTAVDQRWCLVHATHLNDEECRRLATSQAIAGLCITTEANLGDGIFPATEYLTAGGQFGIGSDSHVSVSMMEELRWLEYGQRLRDQKRNRLTHPQQKHVADYLYQGALQGGAQALGQPIGRLEAGYRADWLVIDGQAPFIASSHPDDVLNRWLFAGNSRQIRDVMVGGKWQVRDGHHGLEEQAAERFMVTLRKLFS
ncbi:formimidoylglutamate deiminase [Pokkaliibacter plantistimulans]|uniref:Formimidoylglutamate deiminase n=1 Tax=Proteobacteria bacterium 228 TaxID=2083153 RepID=A0A2S5KMF2_9PROT|nr:formimidoylglutamate deiminase [Pokkaliibacter plantistimulans]PPC75496.1 formimidoylglutamate deiminase [Pokkaliibacter plantistimulans]